MNSKYVPRLTDHPASRTEPAIHYFRECAKITGMNKSIFLILAGTLALSGCEQVGKQLGLEDPAKKEAVQEAEGKAVGSGCRQSGRAIEDCYSIYNWLPKSAVFAGWREMDAYMRENQLETIAPQLPPPENPNIKKRKKAVEPVPENGDAAAKGEEKAVPKAEEKAAAKH